MDSDSSSVFFSFPTRGITHFFTDNQDTTENVEEKNKHGLRLAPSVRNEESVTLCILWANVSVYPNEILTNH